MGLTANMGEILRAALSLVTSQAKMIQIASAIVSIFFFSYSNKHIAGTET